MFLIRVNRGFGNVCYETKKSCLSFELVHTTKQNTIAQQSSLLFHLTTPIP